MSTEEMKSVEIELKRFQGGTKITMREPRVKDIRAHDHIENPAEKDMRVISTLTEISFEDLDNMPFSEFKILQNEFAKLSFLQ